MKGLKMKINFKKPYYIEVHCFMLTAHIQMPITHVGKRQLLTGLDKQDKRIFPEPDLSSKLFLRRLKKRKTQAVVAGLSNTDRNAGWCCGHPLKDMWWIHNFVKLLSDNWPLHRLAKYLASRSSGKCYRINSKNVCSLNSMFYRVKWKSFNSSKQEY